MGDNALLFSIWQPPKEHQLPTVSPKGKTRHGDANGTRDLCRPPVAGGSWAVMTYLLSCCKNQRFASIWVISSSVLFYKVRNYQGLRFSLFRVPFTFRCSLSLSIPAASSWLSVESSNMQLPWPLQVRLLQRMGISIGTASFPKTIFNSMTHGMP